MWHLTHLSKCIQFFLELLSLGWWLLVAFRANELQHDANDFVNAIINPQRMIFNSFSKWLRGCECFWNEKKETMNMWCVRPALMNVMHSCTIVHYACLWENCFDKRPSSAWDNSNFLSSLFRSLKNPKKFSLPALPTFPVSFTPTIFTLFSQEGGWRERRKVLLDIKFIDLHLCFLPRF